MLKNDYAIRNYMRRERGGKSLVISEEDRKGIVRLISDLHRQKDYKIETLYLAVSIADRYLSKLSELNQSVPNLVSLATICILIAAKIEQPISPSFNRMISLLPLASGKLVTKADLVNLEDKILRAL